MFPLRTDLLAVTPHHVLHAHLTQMLRRLQTHRGFTLIDYWLQFSLIFYMRRSYQTEHLHEHFSVKSEFWPQWEQLEEWASSCPGHFWAGSCRGSWGKSSAHNPGNTRSLDSAPCDGRWSLWWTWWRDKKGAGIIKNQQHKVSSQ